MRSPFRCFPDSGFAHPLFERTTFQTTSPVELDARLAEGWRHFGTEFYRMNLAVEKGRICGVLALRIRLDAFHLSKSQRRILRTNADAEFRVLPSRHGADYDGLFAAHRRRFISNTPDSLRDFLSSDPAHTPCENVAIEVYLGGRLAAVSFMDIGANSASSVYAMFDPTHAKRSLGTLTLLLEIGEAQRRGMTFLYIGYAYTVPSFYDYKKRFSALEALDWNHGWRPLPPDFEWSRGIGPS